MLAAPSSVSCYVLPCLRDRALASPAGGQT
jgi:hypothetical protein